MSIRKEAVQWSGAPTDLEGPELKPGDKAPDFIVTGPDMKPVTLKDTTGKVRIFATIPSIDTPVCDTEMRRFNIEAARIPGIEVYAVSMDLPFSTKRWCGHAGVDKVRAVSDYKQRSFGKSWGVFEPNRCLLARAVFVVDRDDVIRHAEYVANVSSEPNYAAALEAARSCQ